MLSINREWEMARTQISEYLHELFNSFDLASTMNVKEMATIISNGTTEVEYLHKYYGIPKGYIVAGQSAAGTLYESQPSDASKMYFKSDVVGTEFKIIIF